MLRPAVRHLLLAVALLLLLAVAWVAVSGGLRQLPRYRTIGQQVETVVQLACGLLSLLSMLTCFRWRRWHRPVLVTWTISLMTAAGLSSLVWGPPMPAIGLAFAAAALLFALAINWLLRAGLAS
jgi:hypothetical protein